MSTCNLGGVVDHKLINFHPELWNIRNSAFVTPSNMNCSRIGTSWGLRGVQMLNRPAARQPWRVANSLAISCLSSERENGADNLEEKQNDKDNIVPSSFEVHSLLTTICDTTSIAEFELKLSGFRVYVKRDLVEENTSAPSPSLPIAAQTDTSNQTPEVNGSASASSLAISKPKPSIQSILETASDEGLVILQSPKVGFFRKSRTIKGKKAPPSCKEKQEVKEGQVLCFIEQLGAEIPIESDVSGEIIKILRADGEPVGYGDALIAILPSFPGIKKLQ